MLKLTDICAILDIFNSICYSCVVVNIFILNPFLVYVIRIMILDVKTFDIVCLEFEHVCLDFKGIYKHEERHSCHIGRFTFLCW